MKQDRTQQRTTHYLPVLHHGIKTWEHLEVDIAKLNDSAWIKKRKIKYCNYPLSFDIETSSFYNNGEKAVCMYIWQAAIGDNVYMGRTWEDWMQFNKILSDGLNLSEDKRLVFYVHNLSYEFQFMRLYYDWPKVFALDDRKVCYAVNSIGIEYRCSYILSNESLDSLAKHLKRPIKKLVGSLEYDLVRGPETELDDEELAYCINDVLIITEFIREQIEIEGNITKIPLTKTGYVRRYCKKMCLYGDNDDKGKRTDSYMRYMKLMKRLTLEPKEYLMLKRAFAGGFTHANIFYVGQKLDDVASQDITSDYPTECIASLFPMSKGKLVHPESEDELKKYLHKYCCVFDIRFYNIQNTFLNEAFISSSKCRDLINPVINNGRVERADMLTITITEQDFFTFAMFYKWDSIGIGDMYIYRRGYLPTPLVKSIIKFYTDKTVLKGLKDEDGHELDEYSQAKGMLNSTYGMMVTDICRPDILYDGTWEVKIPDYDEKIKEYNESKGRFLFFAWGVWVTAHARRNIALAINELCNDYVYSDTDSVKYLHPADHEKFFNDYNALVVEKLKKAMRYHNLPEDTIAPCNQKGDPKPMGVFTYEGTYKNFKTLGAKRYMYTDDIGIHITVAGLGKKQGGQYVAGQQDPYEFFSNGMFIPADHTGKLTHTYIDDTMEGDVTDYKGKRFHYRERTGIHLGPCEFSLSLSARFIELLRGIHDGEED